MWLLFEFVAEGTARSGFFPEGLILYPRCALSIDYLDELMYVYTYTVLKQLYSICSEFYTRILCFSQLSLSLI